MHPTMMVCIHCCNKAHLIMLNNHPTTHFYNVWNVKSLLKMLSKIKLNTFVVSKSTGMLLGALNFMKNYTNVLQTEKKL